MALLYPLALLGLCAAYLQGGLTKLRDYPGAVAEAARFGLPRPRWAAAAVIAVELGGSAAVLLGGAGLRPLGALLLAGFTLVASFTANRFWTLPAGLERGAAMNAFFEHLGLVGGFLLVALLPDPAA